MKLKLQKRLAKQVTKKGGKRVKLDPAVASDLKDAITKADIRAMVSEGLISVKPASGVSRSRERKRHEQRKKGRQKGHGKRKGKKTARTPRKRSWINKIRPQRELLSQLKDKKIIDPKTYRMLYLKAKGGFFRSKRHLMLYTKQHELTKEVKK